MDKQHDDIDATGKAMAEAMMRIMDGEATGPSAEQRRREAENRRAMQSEWWAQACHDRNVKEWG